MQRQTDVYLYGSLPGHIGRKPNAKITIPIDDPTPFSRICWRIGIPVEKVQLIMLNHRAVHPDVQIRPGDRVALFPKEYPFFVDWYHYRNRPKSTQQTQSQK